MKTFKELKEAAILPTVHLNGTGKKTLLDERGEILRAIHTLEKAIQNAAPNGRDHYVKGGQTYDEARKIHMERLKWLETLTQDIYEEIEAIDK